MKFILGTKLGMTQVFREDGTVVPVTRVQAGPCVVTQVKTAKKDGTDAVQIGFGKQYAFRLNKAKQGHLKNLDPVKVLREINTTGDDHGLNRGDQFTVSIFEPGEKVKVIGTSKGRGFQGVVKRHGFAGSPASHGHKDQLRMPGSIGATDAARVFKGTRMGGHMGDQQVTVQNLEIIEIDANKNELLIKGALPGARGGLLTILTGEGKIEIVKEEPAATEEKGEEKKTETKIEEEPKQESTKEKKEEVKPETEEPKKEDGEKESSEEKKDEKEST